MAIYNSFVAFRRSSIFLAIGLLVIFQALSLLIPRLALGAVSCHSVFANSTGLARLGAQPKNPDDLQTLRETKGLFTLGVSKLNGGHRLAEDGILPDHPFPSLTKNIGAIDIGSSKVKVAVLKSTGHLIFQSYEISLGKNLSPKGNISKSAEGELSSVLAKAAEYLKEYQVAKADVIVYGTSGLRNAKNGSDVAMRLSKNGPSVHILSSANEASLIYRAITYGVKNLSERHWVMEVGSGNTQIIRGQGSKNPTPTETVILPTEAAMTKTGKELTESSLNEVTKNLKEKFKEKLGKTSAREEQALIARSTVLEALIKFHNGKSPEQPISDAIPIEVIHHYTSAKGLNELKSEFDPAGTMAGQIATRLAVLRAFAEHTNTSSFKIGAKGGMKLGMILDLGERVLKSEFQNMTATLKTYFTKKENEALDQLRSIFPEALFGKFTSRPKGLSIWDKLVRKGLAGQQSIRFAEQALIAVGDGVGVRLILNDTSPHGMKTFFENLREAIFSGEIIVTEINNYRGKGIEPYIPDRMLDSLIAEAAQRGISIKRPKPRDEIKEAGYTTLQMNIDFRNGVEGEFQVRGSQINWMSEVLHLTYDLEMGKVVQGASKELLAVHMAYRQLNPRQRKIYSQYQTNFIAWGRKSELNKEGREPNFPTELGSFPELDFNYLRRLTPQ